MMKRDVMKDRLILAIETSCDRRTSVAVLRNDAELCPMSLPARLPATQRFWWGGAWGGQPSPCGSDYVLYPEALLEAEVTAEDLTAVAVTYGPGEVGAPC